MLTINETMLKEISCMRFPIDATASGTDTGYILSISCDALCIDNQPLKTARGSVRVFKTFENLEKVCKSFGVNKITVL